VNEPRLRRSPEFDLIAAIRERLAATNAGRAERVRIGIGDDAAVTVQPGGRARAVTVDAIVDGIAFRRSWCPPRSVGRKALGAALSDLAAMGAEPLEAYVWLGMPEDFAPDEALALCDGLAELAAAESVAVLGGDITAAPALSVCVTAIGDGEADAMVGRSGAREGDAVCVTGTLGGAAAGLMVLEHPELCEGLSDRVCRAVEARQLEPRPQVAAGRALAASGVSAMIDISDGLGAEAEHLAAASGVGIEVEVDRIHRAVGVAEVADAAGRDPYELMVGGGEDYELLCTVPRASLVDCAEAVAEAGTELREIGRVVSGPAVRLRLPGGRSVPASGHDQLRGF